MTTPRFDGKSSVMIRCSRGGETDPRRFYCTTYATQHNFRNTMKNRVSERVLNKQFWWPEPDQSIVRLKVQAAGYQRNLLPCFTYDKAVDEYESRFRDDHHFDTTTHTTFRKPDEKHELPDVHGNNKYHSHSNNNQANAVINGPEISKYQPLASEDDVKSNSKWNVFESTMKSSYKSGKPLFPHLAGISNVNITGKDHESGSVRNRDHSIAGLTDQLSNLERGLNVLTLSDRIKNSHKVYNLSKVGDTGYNRSDYPIPDADSSKPNAMPAFVMERIRKSNPEDHSFLSAHPQNVENDHIVKTNGTLQATAAVHDTPDPNLLTAMQFRSWDTSYTSCYGPHTSKYHNTIMSNQVHPAVDHSGYSLCNKYEFEPLKPNGIHFHSNDSNEVGNNIDTERIDAAESQHM